jgi:hypothetical protein
MDRLLFRTPRSQRSTSRSRRSQRCSLTSEELRKQRRFRCLPGLTQSPPKLRKPRLQPLSLSGVHPQVPPPCPRLFRRRVRRGRSRRCLPRSVRRAEFRRLLQAQQQRPPPPLSSRPEASSALRRRRCGHPRGNASRRRKFSKERVRRERESSKEIAL